MTATTYCIDSSKKLYSSTHSASCEVQSLTKEEYYLFKCTNKNSCTKLASGAGIPEAINQLTGIENLLLYYVNDSEQLIQKKDGFFYLETTNSKMLTCPGGSFNGKCSLSVTPGYYVNTGTNSNVSDAAANPLLNIDQASGDATAIEKDNVLTGNYYIDANSEVGLNEFTKIISCVDNEGTIVCTSKAPSEGYYLNAAREDLATSIIACKGNPIKCEIVTGTQDFSFIDTGKEGNIISCGAASCSTAPGNKLQGHAYRDGSDTTTKKVIITYNPTSNKFVSTILTLPAAPGLYYIDGLDPKKLIKCVTGSGCDAPDDILSNSSFHVDGTQSDYTITCRGDEGCFSSKGNHHLTD